MHREGLKVKNLLLNKVHAKANNIISTFTWFICNDNYVVW